jgi:hypothetical protein
MLAANRPQQQGGLANIDPLKQWQQGAQGKQGSELRKFTRGLDMAFKDPTN